MANPCEIGSQADQHGGGNALTLTYESEEQVLGTDVAVVHVENRGERVLKNLFGTWRERRRAGRRGPGRTDHLLDHLAHGLQGDPERRGAPEPRPVTLAGQPEEDVLSANEGVIEQTRFRPARTSASFAPGR